MWTRRELKECAKQLLNDKLIGKQFWQELYYP